MEGSAVMFPGASGLSSGGEGLECDTGRWPRTSPPDFLLSLKPLNATGSGISEATGSASDYTTRLSRNTPTIEKITTWFPDLDYRLRRVLFSFHVCPSQDLII